MLAEPRTAADNCRFVNSAFKACFRTGADNRSAERTADSDLRIVHNYAALNTCAFPDKNVFSDNAVRLKPHSAAD